MQWLATVKLRKEVDAQMRFHMGAEEDGIRCVCRTLYAQAFDLNVAQTTLVIAIGVLPCDLHRVRWSAFKRAL